VPAEYLSQLLGQSEHIQELIKQTAHELSAADAAIKQALVNSGHLPGMIGALDNNEVARKKLHSASENLSTVNQALQVEIRDRTMVDHQLAAAVEQEEGSRHAAMHDHLTGLPNRALFKDRLDRQIAHAKRYRRTLAVMFLDLDNFKAINDTHGHQAGDAVLQTVAARLAQNTRNDDTVSRYGGDEFLCLLTPLHGQEDAAIIATKILKAIQTPCDVRVGDVVIDLCLEASIGISVFPNDGATAATLITQADEAMYAAKENRSGIAFAQQKAVLGATTHRRPMTAGLPCHNAPRVFDEESSAIDQPLPGKGGQKIRAHGGRGNERSRRAAIPGTAY
jgi:diguanylate cyclase (GGDEF)-like protein